MPKEHLSQAASSLLKATVGETGDRFFAAMAGALAANLNARWALVGEFVGDRIQVLAGHGDGQPLDPFDYEVSGSPCEQVLAKQACTYTQGVAQCFPKDQLLTDMGVESYFGVGVYNSAGQAIGIINAMSDKPMAETPEVVPLLRLFAMRVGAEIERRSFEQQLINAQKLESIGVLTSGIAHDFNNLLVGILGNLENAISATSAENQPAMQSLNEASTAANAASELVKQLLSYAGGGTIDRKTIAIGPHVAETVQMVSHLIDSETAVAASIAADLPDILGDHTQLRQVIMNLITNASEALAGHPGEVTVRVEPVHDTIELARCHYHAETFDPTASYIAVRVQDTGVGMSKDAVRQIFDPFFSTKGQSRGLGLSAVLGILRSHDGAIAIESTEGEGSQFHVYLPTSTEATAAAASSQPKPAPQPTTEAIRVLIVDDEEIVRNTLRRTLVRLGYDVVDVENGDKALAAVKQNPKQFACVVVDRMMPGISGEQLIANIRSVNPDMPIVLTTGFADDIGLANDAIHAVLPKPWTTDDVSRAIHKALDA